MQASELFASCGSDEGCPNPIRTECVEFYRETEKHIPTVIFTLADAQGRDITDVRVYSTDQLLTESLNGRPIPLDPGKHQFRFVLPGGDVLNSDVLVREGEKNRVVSARAQESSQARSKVAPTLAGGMAPGQATSATLSTNGKTGQGQLPASFWVAAGVGAAAFASWGVFALLGHSEQSKFKDCSPNCAPSLRDNFDAMRRDYLIADLSLGVAAVSAGVATWLFIANKRSNPVPDERSATGSLTQVSVIPLLSAPGVGLMVKTNGL